MPNWDEHKASGCELFIFWKLKRGAVMNVESNLLVLRFVLGQVSSWGLREKELCQSWGFKERV